MIESPRDILLVSTADWDNPSWTNKQHVAMELAKRGHRVLYIESQGLRAPTATKRDFGRMFRRLKRSLRGARQVNERIWVWSPLIVPFQAGSAVRHLNRLILTYSSTYLQRILGMKHDILWAYSPLTSTLFDLSLYKTVVYHAVDDMKTQPGMPVEAIRKGEIELAKAADIIFTTSKNLYAFYVDLNLETHYFPNVADYSLFAGNSGTSRGGIPADISHIPQPRLGFVGAISSYKVDFELLVRLSKRREGWQFILIGDVGEGQPDTDISSLRERPNIHLVGPRAYQSLPAYLSSFDVGLLPSRLTEYTASMFPMKFFEYLSAGLPVISTKLPGLLEFGDIASLCETDDEFIQSVEKALLDTPSERTSRMNVAKRYTYEARQDQMMSLLAVVENARVK